MEGRAGIVSLGVLLLVPVACTLFLASCAGKRGGSEETSPGGLMDQAIADSLEAGVTLNAGGYAMDEPIKMRLEVVNTAGRAITLTFPSAQRYDFIVKKGKQTIWQWSEGRMFAQVLGRYDLGPGDTISYEYKWDQTAGDGTKPGLGAYTFEGLLMISPPLKTERKTFGIVD
jgi:hypothetical protein